MAKYFKAEVHVLANGPGGDPLNFVFDKVEISEVEFNIILNEFFGRTSEAKKMEVIRKIFPLFNKGKSITLKNIQLSTKGTLQIP